MLQSPFSTEIRTRALPPKFKMPNLEVYDGSGDPMDHPNHFREHLSLQGLDETTMCQCFPLTLKGDTRIWFYGMPTDSIRNFGNLAMVFLSQFASSKRVEKQKDGEAGGPSCASVGRKAQGEKVQVKVAKCVP